jgi:uncharacterized protein
MTESSRDPRRKGTLAPIDEAEAWQLLGTTTVGRLGFTTDEGIVILPVNFIVHEERIYVRTEHGSTVAALAGGRDDVAFEVDYHSDLNQFGWNVLVHAQAAEADPDEAERAIASSTRLGPWAPGDRTLVIALTPGSITGRRVSLH